MKIRVYYEDTDVGGVVYHSNYLNFCERARSDIFFKKGLNPILESGHFVAKKLEADYISSAKFGDELEIVTTLKEMRNASFELLQVVLKDNKKIFELKIILAYVSHEAKPQRITSAVKEMLLELFSV